VNADGSVRIVGATMSEIKEKYKKDEEAE